MRTVPTLHLYSICLVALHHGTEVEQADAESLLSYLVVRLKDTSLQLPDEIDGAYQRVDAAATRIGNEATLKCNP